MAGTVKITKALALRLLKEAVEKKGADYVDPGAKPDADGDCTYAKGNRPGCIVGHVLHGVGVKPQTLRDLDNIMFTSFVTHRSMNESDRREGRGVVAALASQGVVVTERAIDVLAAAQGCQDVGKTWGVALSAARKA